MGLSGFLRGQPFRWILTCGVFALIFSRINANGLREALKTVRWEWFGLSFAVMLSQGLVSAWALSRLMRAIGIPKSFREVLRIQYTAFYYSSLGGVVGGAVRWHGIAGEARRRGAALFAILLDNFLMGMAYASLFLVSFFWEGYGRFAGPERRVFLFYAFFLAAGCLAGVTVLFYAPVFSFVERTVKGWRAERSWARSFQDKVKILVDVWKNSRSGSKDVRAAAAAWLLHAALMIVSMKAVTLAAGIDVGWETAAWVCALAKTVQVIPVTFFGLGITEGIMMFAFARYGQTSEQAFLAGFQLSGAALIASLGCGVWMAARLARR